MDVYAIDLQAPGAQAPERTVPCRAYLRLTMFDCTFAIVSSRPRSPGLGEHAVNPRARRKVSRARAELTSDTRTSVPSQARRSLFVMVTNPYPAGLSATATGAIPTSLRDRPHPLTAAKCANFVPIAGSPLKPLLGAARPKVVMLANTQDQTLEMPCRPISDPFPKITATSVSHPTVSNPTGITLSQAEEANIARVKVDLPKQLPSRLTTLQKACTAAVFDANPAACPAASIVASAKAITPILPVPLEGPAYFVSHGNEAFPQLILVLQGYGITIDLVGDTFISKAGITSSTFAHVPDAPVSSFELTLPEGKYSALAANGNLCALTKTVTVKKKVTVRVHGRKRTVTRNVKETKPTTLTMPTEFIGQNGAVIHQSTPISVTGCPKAHKAKHKAKKKSKKKSKGKKK